MTHKLRKPLEIVMTLAIGLVVLLFLVGLGLSFETRAMWSISVYSGQSPTSLAPLPVLEGRPVLSARDVTDRDAIFVADPFMVDYEQRWYMFFELFHGENTEGDIGLATSEDGIEWRYEQVVLDESFHLAYPYVFEWQGRFYLIPDCSEAESDSVRLYEATRFPYEWKMSAELVQGEYLDPTLAYEDGVWWLFLTSKDYTLHLFASQSPMGPWGEVPGSPVIQRNKMVARPGGRVVTDGTRTIRFVQDCESIYGGALRVFQIDSLTPSAFSQHELLEGPLLSKSGEGWNADRMHHADAHQLGDGTWLAAVDGAYNHRDFNLRRGLWRVKTAIYDALAKVAGR
jgi:hypothetical protein